MAINFLNSLILLQRSLNNNLFVQNNNTNHRIVLANLLIAICKNCDKLDSLLIMDVSNKSLYYPLFQLIKAQKPEKLHLCLEITKHFLLDFPKKI